MSYPYFLDLQLSNIWLTHFYKDHTRISSINYHCPNSTSLRQQQTNFYINKYTAHQIENKMKLLTNQIAIYDMQLALVLSKKTESTHRH